MSNLNIHLTDHPNNKISSNNEENISEQDNENKWTLKSLKNYFSKNNLNFNKIWEKIKDIMIKTIISVTDLAIPLIKSFNLNSVNLFELYGIDILLDSNLNPWLIEVNLNPSLDCSTQIDLKLKSKLITDIFNIIGIVPFSHDGKFELMDKPNIYKDSVEEGVIESLCEFERPTGEFERIFPLKNNIEYYRKFISKPGQENLALWEKILNSK